MSRPVRVIAGCFSDELNLLLRSGSSGHAPVKWLRTANILRFDDAALQKHARPKRHLNQYDSFTIHVKTPQSHSVNCKICSNTYLQYFWINTDIISLNYRVCHFRTLE